MSQLLRRHTRVTCFFCQLEATPRDPRAFRCPSCQCWNRYDAHGEIISEEPAMHDENLNAKSFAKRASPRKDRFLATFSNTLFCHTCQTNQMLGSNIMSNYLPPPEHPDHSEKLRTFDAHRADVERRYPPVCANCQPAVDEEISRRNQMAQVNALGGFLKDSKRKGKQRAGEATQAQKDGLERSLFWWRIRGLLWFITLMFTLVVYASAAFDYHSTRLSKFLGVPSLTWTLLSVFWAAWDPAYATKKRNELQGRPIRQSGKKQYNILQTLAWSSRLITSVLFALPRYRPSQDYLHLHNSFSSIPRIYCSVLLILETTVVITSFVVVQVKRTPAVHLIDSSYHRPSNPSSTIVSRATTPSLDPSAVSSLSISHTTSTSSSLTNPIFGLPSLPTSLTAPERSSPFDAEPVDDVYDDEGRDPNAMDWSPTPQSPTKRGSRLQRDDNGFILRPQKFYAPEEPTGLENLFERTIKLADSGDELQSNGRTRTTVKNMLSIGALWVQVSAAASVMAAVGFGVWWQKDRWIPIHA